MMQLDGLAGFDDQPTGAQRDAVDGGLNFLWLELTNRYNLQCVRCHTESHPLRGTATCSPPRRMSRSCGRPTRSAATGTRQHR